MGRAEAPMAHVSPDLPSNPLPEYRAGELSATD